MRAYRIARRVLLVALLVALPVDARRHGSMPAGLAPPRDIFSASEPADVRTTHLLLDLEVDFDAREIRGAATHRIINLRATRRFIVDTRRLEIRNVTVDGQPAHWSLATSTKTGQPLTIEIEPTSREVRIEYETMSTSQATRWLTAPQTAGGVAPFLFTLTEPDRTREWIPLQDTPGVRMTYEANVRVPPGLLALMSARNPTEARGDGLYRFEMPYPIAPYLIAIAVGRLEFRALSDRTGFYAEPELADDASWDLAYVPEMLEIAERLMGPYPFDRYDLLLTPPAFSGGMEHPMLNFLGVLSVVKGDRETPPVPTDLVAHELAHSWAGDLVTCATWSDLWLNEGFATYYAKRILEEMMGAERSELGFYWNRITYEDWAADTNPRITTLHREFLESDTPSVFNAASYDKGSVFLKTLEDLMGRLAFDEFIRSYFRTYSFRWVDARAFLDALGESPAASDALLAVEWIYESGFPGNVTAPSRSVLWERIATEANRFRSGTPASQLATSGWRSFELSLFLWQITAIVPQRMEELDAAFHLSSMKSPSIHWQLAVATKLYAPSMPMFERTLMLGGSNVISIYQRLIATEVGRAYAHAIYQRARPRYDPNTQSRVDQILGVRPAALRDAA